MSKPPSPNEPSPARNADLEECIENDPDAVDAYQVFADYLRTQEDPRADLIAVQAALAQDAESKELRAREAELFYEFGEQLLGPLGPLANRRTDRREACIGWHLGFIRSAVLSDEDGSPNTATELSALLDHFSGRFLRDLTLQAADPKPAIDVLMKRERRTLRSLALGFAARAQSAVRLAPEFFRCLPGLETLALDHPRFDLSGAAPRSLTELRLGSSVEAESLETVSSARFPQLRAFSFACGTVSPALRKSILANEFSESLQTVAVYFADFYPESFGEVVRSPLLKRARVAAFEASWDEDAIDTLVEAAGELAHLDRVLFEIGGASREQRERVTRAMPNAAWVEPGRSPITSRNILPRALSDASSRQAVHPRWLLPPRSYKVRDRVFLPGSTHPRTDLVARRWIESRLAAVKARRLDAPAWLLAMDRPWDANAKIQKLWASRDTLLLEDRLHLGYLLDAGSCQDELMAAEVYEDVQSNKELDERHPLWFEIELAHASEPGMAYDNDRKSATWDRLRSKLSLASPLAAAALELNVACHELRRERFDACEEANVRAFERFEMLEDPEGMAQCAIVEYRRELSTWKRPEALRSYIEYAAARYSMASRHADAAQLIAVELLPLLRSEEDDTIRRALERAAELADRGRSSRARDLVARAAFEAKFIPILARTLMFQKMRAET